MTNIQRYFNNQTDTMKYMSVKRIKEIGEEAWYKERIERDQRPVSKWPERSAFIFGTAWVLLALYGLSEGWLS